ncbi:MAG: hypothetical protein ONB44_15115 [candidate division KSB1 bacterium]|nr:hypothetical protein [candidate division KSB1 bacterium]MDZ7303459.1 hypothetical protein [candidate division KSB1 bacterium]MDZ7312541.1 hypothetical protein [candidate division KSB1 bacterium]
MAKSFFIGICVFALLSTSCASRLPMIDEVGKPVTEEEIKQHRSNKNFWLFTIGGGALSFGASFFAGALIDRNSQSTDHTKLWLITGTGTVVGTALFIHNGRVRDFNAAVEAVKDSRKETASQSILQEQKRQGELAEEKKKLEEERKRQEAERKRLLEEIRKKQKNAQEKP